MPTVADLRRLEDELRAAESRRHVLEGEVRTMNVEHQRAQQELARIEIEMSKREALIHQGRPLEEGIRRRIANLRYELEGARLKANGVAGYDARVKVGLYPPRRR
jgi:predicted  nucleic acid-binding Zn-ribbon protein